MVEVREGDDDDDDDDDTPGYHRRNHSSDNSQQKNSCAQICGYLGLLEAHSVGVEEVPSGPAQHSTTWAR
jgi:hypothetical protein